MSLALRSPFTRLAAALALAAPLSAQSAVKTADSSAAANIGVGTIRYPDTRRVEQIDIYHGTAVADPFRWLEDTDSPETRAWIEAQNAVTFVYLERIPERDAIRKRLTELWDYPQYGVPWREGKRTFWFENSGLQNQSVLYVQDGRKDAPRVLIDPNAFSSDGTVALAAVEVSPDGNLIAYGTSASGSDWQEFHVRDVKTGRDLPDTLKWIKFSEMAWTPDNKGFFYARYDEPTDDNRYTAVVRNQKLYYHRLGTPQSADQLILENRDEPEWGWSAEVTEDGQFVIVSVWQGTDERNRLYLIDLGSRRRPKIDNPVVRLFDDFDATYDFIGNEGTRLFVRTTRDAPRGKVVSFDLLQPRPQFWRTIIPESKDALTSVDHIGGRLVAHYLQDARSVIRVHSMGGSPLGEVGLPTLGTVSRISGRRWDKDFYYGFTSFLHPTAIYRYDLEKEAAHLVKAPTLGVDLSQYETKQLFFHSRDSTRVPMFVTMKKGTQLDGMNPTLLYAYGGFNIAMTPGFSPANLVWLERGGIYALANLRGGGEYGEEWHQAGMFERKQNVFDDFIAAAGHLVAERYTSPSRLGIFGGSNGGLLVGAVINQRPDLFGAAIPAVGVMDMLRYHKFTIGWAWASEYGSADDSTHFPHLFAYSPLHNIKPGAHYPPTMITTADHDDRVLPGHSFKYAAALQTAQGGPAPILIRIDTKAGHGAGKPTAKRIEEAADRLTFLWHHLGRAKETAGR